MNDHDIDRLYAGYRAAIEEPAYGAMDWRVLRAAARRARNRRLQRVLLGAPALSAAALLLLATGAAVIFAVHRDRAGAAQFAAVADIGSKAATPAVQLSPAMPLRLTMTAEQWAPSPTGGMPLQPVPVQAPVVAPSPHILPPATPARPATVDLNVPGTLDALKRRRPADYARIVAILAGLQQHRNRDVPRWMATTFNAKNVMYAPLWLTSFPPKRRLSFSLDGTRYRVVVTITRDGARVFPIDENAR
ncbi:MAG: hypothetical protein ACREU2_13125 [Steroidobacteraceae bacterium]